MAIDNADVIRTLNDILRTTGAGGNTVFVGALGQAPEIEKMAAYQAVREFDSFPQGDDPYREHDFGSFSLDGKAYTWKIDYYDKDTELGSDNPANASVTTRVLSIFYANDY